MKKLYLTRKLPEDVMLFLEKNFVLTFNAKDEPVGKQELIENIRANDILLCLLTDSIDVEILKANPNLLGVCNYAVGYNNIDVHSATELNIPVTNTPGVLTETTAELTFSLLLACSRRIVEADKFCRDDNFKGWAPELLLGTDLFGKKIGIIGAGRIGTRVGKIAAAFDMDVLYYNGKSNAKLHEIIDEADFISIHVPFTKKTFHMFGENEFRRMKSNTILVNTSRGAVLDEQALVNALINKEIAGAALDVFEFEPMITEQLKTLSNVVLAPHIGSATIETRTKMGMIAAQNALDIGNGKIPRNIVNNEIYDK
jgi:glyoxylate reductase